MFFCFFFFYLEKVTLHLQSLPQFLNPLPAKCSLLRRPTINCFRSTESGRIWKFTVLRYLCQLRCGSSYRAVLLYLLGSKYFCAMFIYMLWFSFISLDLVSERFGIRLFCVSAQITLKPGCFRLMKKVKREGDKNASL